LVRIEKLLAVVNHPSGFTEAFKPLPGYETRGEVPLSHLLAALIAHGTNVGLFGMGHSTEAVTVDQLRHALRWLIRESNLNVASARLIASHRRYPVSQVWGDGHRSSSDGQRFGIEASSLLASYYPRYFGYYDKAITIYTHQLKGTTEWTHDQQDGNVNCIIRFKISEQAGSYSAMNYLGNHS
jgi:hypothetical protein